jgi:hypothetical protein
VAKIPKKKWYEAGDALAGLYADSVEWLDKSSAAVRAEAQKARMQRAKDQGYDIGFLHGSPTLKESDSVNLDHPPRTDSGYLGKALYGTESPFIAKSYADPMGSGPSGGVLELKTRAKKFKDFVYDENYKKTIADFGESIGVRAEPHSQEWATEFSSKMQANGYEGSRGLTVDGGVVEIAVYDPSNIRSVNAQFDPAKRKSSKLLASAMGAGVLGTAALTPQEAEAGVVNVFNKGRQLVGEFDDRFLGGVGGSSPRVNLRDRVANMETSVTPRDMSRPSNVNLYDYEGSPYILTQSDRSAAGGELTGINNTDISPVDLRGGRDYMFDPKSEGTVWASAPSVVNSLGGRASVAASRQGKDTILLPYSMAPTGIDFATMPLDAMVGFARANMSKANKKALDKGIKDIIPEWNGVADPDSVEVFRTVAGPKRKAIADLMDKKFRNVKGGMSISEARAATSDPAQMITPDGEITNLGTINATDNIAQSTHPTYTGGLRGEGVGVLSDPLSVRPFMEQNGRVLAGDSSDIRALSMNHGLSQGIIDSNLLKSVYGNANPLLLGGIAATTAAGLALSGEAEAGVGKGIKSALRVFDTEDGYRFFELSDGTLVDNLDPDAVDMAFDNIKQLKDEMGDGVFQIGDELAKARYSKNNVDISELNRKYYKDMDSSPQKGNANPLLLGGVAATTAAGLALSGEAEAGPINIIDPITGLIRKGIEAYHGSPHKFDPSVRVRNKKTGKEHILAKNSWDNPNSPYKGTGHPLDPDLREEFEVLSDNPLGAFSMDNIGTGEGAQAYGHGLYFADNKEVGEQYRRVVGGSGGWDGKLPANVGEIAKGLSDEKQGLLLARWQNLGDDGAKGLLRDWQLKGQYDNAQEYDAVVDLLNNTEWDKTGSLYRTELDVDPDTLLDWDKPLSEQSESVRERVSSVFDRIDTSGIDSDILNYTGEDIENVLGRELKDQNLTNANTYSEAAKDALKEAGIPGIRYLDGDSRNRPAIDIQNEFLNELPEDASIEEVVEMLGTGQFSPKNEELISALDDDNWLGFDFPAQAISVALGRNASNYDVSPRLTQAVKNAQVDNPTSNYVMFDDSKISIKERGMATPAALAATAVAGGAGIGPALNLSDIAVGGAETSALQPLADQEYIDEAPVREMEGATGALIMELLQETQRSSQEFSMQHAAKAELRAARKAEVLRATGVAVNIAKGVVAAPWKGLAGINALGTSLFAGTGLDEAINIAGNTARMSNDQAVDQGFAFLDKPMQGYQGMASVASGLVTGEGIQGALNAGADTANRSVDENARLYGDMVYEGMDQYDATRPLAPAFGALTYGGMLVGAPF